MRTRSLFCLTIALLALPQALASQGIAVGARVGTLGLGGEAALGLSDNLVVRGGVGSFFMDYTGDMDGVEYTFTPPSITATVGVDLYPSGGSFRLMAGLMFRDGEFDVETGPLSDYEGSIEIGDEEYDEDGQLFGTLASKSTAPFVGLGFGHHTQGGFGVFMDFGVAFVGEADVTLKATGDIAAVPGFQAELDKEVQSIEDDYASYLKYWPILSFGLKIPVG
jgi:hypothetical protein